MLALSTLKKAIFELEEKNEILHKPISELEACFRAKSANDLKSAGQQRIHENEVKIQ